MIDKYICQIYNAEHNDIEVRIMPEKNKTRYAILGVLGLKPCSGYEIKKFFDKVISHFWNESFGNIYPMLSQLEHEGLIEKRHEDAGRRSIRYGITGTGLEEFRGWLALPVEFKPARSELLLKLSFASQMPAETTIGMLESVRKKYASDLKQYKTLEASYIHDEEAKKDPQFPYWLAPLRYGIEMTAAAMKWCDETMESIGKKSKEV
jgi:PadR family transcriptional regulator AphA